MLIFAQYTIYRLYIISNYTTKVTNVYKLLAEFKRELIMNLKFLVKMKLIDFTQKQFSELESGWVSGMKQFLILVQVCIGDMNM